MDITDAVTRSRMMSAIRGKDTTPELAVRRALHARGLRYRLHSKELLGKPDLVFPRYRVVLFVHGCFWHQHGCSNSSRPKTRASFWANKLDANIQRDAINRTALLDAGWRVGVVWECAIRAATKRGDVSLYEDIARWITSGCANQASF